MRIIFMGTPEFAVRSLEALINSRHEVLAVISQPDRQKDKKGNIVFSCVKEFSLKNNLVLFQFEKIKDNVSEIKRFNPDIMVTAAYGQILSKQILEIPKYGVINVHASLLPKYRGSSPVQHAIINGEQKTGITIMQTAEGLDTGDIISSLEIDILPSDTAQSILKKLSVEGAKLLIKTLDDIENGKARKIKQNECKATKCPLITKTDGLINWQNKAIDIRNKIHGLNPWPLAYSFLDGKRISLFRAEIYEGIIPLKVFESGEISVAGGNFVVSCGDGLFLNLLEVQAENKKKMSGVDFVRGLRLTQNRGFKNDR